MSSAPKLKDLAISGPKTHLSDIPTAVKSPDFRRAAVEQSSLL